MSNGVSDVSAASQSEDKNIKLITEHIENKLLLSPSGYAISIIRTKDLPPGVVQYYVEEKNVDHGRAFTYLIYKDELYCSGVDGDLARFLKDFKILDDAQLEPKRLHVLVSKFLDLRDQLLIDEGRITNPRDALKPYLQKVSAPKLVRLAGGLEYVFFTHSVTVQPVRKYAITIGPDYKVAVNSDIVAG